MAAATQRHGGWWEMDDSGDSKDQKLERRSAKMTEIGRVAAGDKRDKRRQKLNKQRRMEEKQTKIIRGFICGFWVNSEYHDFDLGLKNFGGKNKESGPGSRKWRCTAQPERVKITVGGRDGGRKEMEGRKEEVLGAWRCTRNIYPNWK